MQKLNFEHLFVENKIIINFFRIKNLCNIYLTI